MNFRVHLHDDVISNNDVIFLTDMWILPASIPGATR